MIIWLASYPKSGNTWIRAFISSLLFSKDGINDFSNLSKIRQFPNRDLFKSFVKNFQDPKEIYTNWKNAQDQINLDNKIKFFKTHHVNCEVGNFKFTDNNNSLGVIHIVRDPRTVLLSMKKHFKLNDFQQTKEIIFDENSCIGFVKKDGNNKNLSNKVPTLIGSWGLNYLSWKNKIQNYLLIKYEDLVSNPKEEFYKISSYLEKLMECKFDKYKINNAIQTTSFDKLQELEKAGKFKEYKQNSNFFHLGPKNDWKTILDTKIVDEINFKFKNEMLELGYLK